MGVTVPGGRYVTSDGRVVDANGHPLDPDPLTVAPTKPEPEVGLPRAFPHRDALHAAGLTTPDMVRAASDAELLAIPTIGKAALRAIRAAE